MDDSDMLITAHREQIGKYAAEYEHEAEERDQQMKEIFGNDIFNDKSLSPVNQRLDVSPKKLFSPGGEGFSRRGIRGGTATLDSIKSRLRLEGEETSKRSNQQQNARPSPPFTSFQEECLHLREANNALKRRVQKLSALLSRFVTS